MVGLQHLRDLGDGRAEWTVIIRSAQEDHDKGQHLTAHRLGVRDGANGDGFFLQQPADAFVDRRNGKPHLRSNGGLREPAIPLQQVDYFAVKFVHDEIKS